ncbi:MAG: TrmJ/YjtD family RNA methyltransferase [Hydrogenophilus sp.]|nr:TrmJ/YjtD family RNA methyltransferase [Hydrogenophilus sp.]
MSRRFYSEMREQVVFVVVRPRHPGNVGAVARAMWTMGFSRLVLVAPACPLDDPEAQARASGAEEVLAKAQVVARLEEALANTVYAAAFTARSRLLVPPFRTPEEAAAEAFAAAAAAPTAEVAFVFGNERTGLTTEEILRCTAPASIPANPCYASLNLAAAVQVVAYVAARTLREGRMPHAALPEPEALPATAAEIDGLVTQMLELAAEVGFYDPAEPKRLEARLRRFFARARIEQREVHLLRGLLRACRRR